jgi:hypothetical protein
MRTEENKTRRKIFVFVSLIVLFAAAIASPTQSQYKDKKFDLSKLNGGPTCLMKGRFQDKGYNESPVVEDIILRGKDSVPILIDMISDPTPTKEPAFCYWPKTTYGDLAFFMLTDLFLDATWEHSTLSGASLQDLLWRKPNEMPMWDHYAAYLKKHGPRDLQRKWTKLWAEYRDKVEWDAKDRCYRLPR